MITFGQWMKHCFPLLASLKFLRGTPLDVFGYTHERRTERALIVEYRAAVEEMLKNLTAENIDHALSVANAPEQIRGFGVIKLAAVEKARIRWNSAGVAEASNSRTAESTVKIA